MITQTTHGCSARIAVPKLWALMLLAAAACAKKPTVEVEEPEEEAVVIPRLVLPVAARPEPPPEPPSPPTMEWSPAEAAFPEVQVKVTQARSLPDFRRETLGIVNLTSADGNLGLVLVVEALRAGLTRVIDLGRAAGVQVTLQGRDGTTYQADLGRMIHIAKVSRADYLLLLHEVTTQQGKEVVEVHGTIDSETLEPYRAEHEKYENAVGAWIAGELRAVGEYVVVARKTTVEYENRARAVPDAVLKMRMEGVLREAGIKIAAWTKALAGAASGRDAALEALAVFGHRLRGKPPPEPDAYVEEIRKQTKPERVAVCDVTLFATVADAETGETFWAARSSKRHTSCEGATDAIRTKLMELLVGGEVARSSSDEERRDERSTRRRR